MNNTNNAAFDVVVIGDVNADLVLTGNATPVFGQVEKLLDDAALSLGGSAAIFACGAARLGLRVAFIGKVGDDQFGQFVTSELSKCGVDVSGVVCDPQHKTGLTTILSKDGDRALLTFPGAVARLSYQDIDAQLISKARHIHIASYFLLQDLQPDILSLCNLAHQHNLTISLDTNYDPSERWNTGNLLEHVDIFLPNETELLAVTGASAVDTALEKLSTPIVAVKLGSNGATLSASAAKIHTSAVQVDVVDTTGAGDNFDAGFVYGYLQRWSMENILNCATVCGSLSTRAKGGTAGQASHQEIARFLAS